MSEIFKLTIQIPEEFINMISDLLLGLNAQAVSHDVDSEKPETVHCYFEKEKELNSAIAGIKRFMDLISDKKIKLKYKVAELTEKDWEDWKSFLKAVKVSKNIVITPPWENYISKSHEHIIEINPSLAFGTGHHETTKLCIRYLEELLEESNKSILDVGCGSGILGICGIKLGANKVLCIDNDPKAIKETLSNSHRNDIEDTIDSYCGTIDSVIEHFNIVVANISVETLILIKDEILKRIEKNGFIILSGIPESRKNEVLENYIDKELKLISSKTENNWVALLYQSQKR